MSLTDERSRALGIGNAKRVERARIRSGVLDGSIAIREILEEPPPAVHGLTLYEVVHFTRRDRRSGVAWRSRLGRAAVRDGVNLLMPVERACRESREWCAENAPKVWRVSGG